MEGQRPDNITGALPLQPYSSLHATNIIGALPFCYPVRGCEASRKCLTLETAGLTAIRSIIYWLSIFYNRNLSIHVLLLTMKSMACFLGNVQKCVVHLHLGLDYQSITWGVPHFSEHSHFFNVRKRRLFAEHPENISIYWVSYHSSILIPHSF